MKRPIWKRIRYKRIAASLLITVAIATGVYGIYHEINRERMAMHPTIKYTFIAKKGETLWGLCRNVDNEIPTSYLVWLAMKQNHLNSAYNLQEGQEITITLDGK